MPRLANFDKAVMGEISINLLGPSLNMMGKLMMVSTLTGKSYCSMTLHHWSPQVIEKLRELRELMESDAERLLFEDEGRGQAVRAGTTQGEGLGEHLAADEAPSV